MDPHLDSPAAPHSVAAAPVNRRRWGVTPAGDVVHAYDVQNARGTRFTVLTLGATITSLFAADRHGSFADIVLGLDDVDGYLTRSPYFGTVAGRFANRIARGRFTLDGEAYVLATNNAPNHLHGGVDGFDKRVYTARAVTTREGAGVKLTLVSPDGDQGYPGEVHFSVRYLLGDDDRLVIDYEATSTRPTPFNPSQHTYWNLAGSGDVLAHELRLYADQMTPVDATLIPLGAHEDVTGTPFDFRSPVAIGARIGDDHEQLRIGHGYDHNFVLRRPARRGALVAAATLRDPASGRTLEVLTTEPGVQLYTSNYLDGSILGKGGVPYHKHAGVCLETQHFPDSPNRPDYPSTILRPGVTFRSRTVWALGVDTRDA